MGRALLVLALVPRLALGAPDGGAELELRPDWASPLYSDCPDAGPALAQPGGGWLLPADRAARNACLMATCDVRRQQLEAAPPPLGMTSLLFSALAFGAGLVLGGYVAWNVARWLPR